MIDRDAGLRADTQSVERANHAICVIVLASLSSLATACGGRGVGSDVTLMPAPKNLLAVCAHLSRLIHQQRARWRVVCPPQVPGGESELVGAGAIVPVGNTSYMREGYALNGFSRSRTTTNPFRGHWTFFSGDPNAVHNWLVLPDGTGRPQVHFTRRRARIAGQSVFVYRVAPGQTQLSGHVVVEWTYRGQAYQVSVHRWLSDRQGYEQATQMAEAIIRALRRRRG